MTTGPVDFVVVRFPGSTMSPSVVGGLRQLVDSGTIRVIDLLFVTKNDGGDLTVVELSDLDEETYSAWDEIVSDIAGYLTDDDALVLADTLDPGTSAVLTLIENVWAQRMVQAIRDADGEVLISERLPRPIVDEFFAHH